MSDLKKVLGCLAVPLLLLGGFIAFLVIASLLRTRRFVEPKETAVVTGASRILSVDYDRETNVLYFIREQRDGNVLFRLDLATGEERILHVQSPGAVGWVSVSRRGTVYVLDRGDNPYDFHWKETTQPLTILELKGATVVQTLPILTPTTLFEKSGQEKKARASIVAGCAAFTADSAAQAPLGIERIDRIVKALTAEAAEEREALLEKTPFVYLPRFLVLSSEAGPDVAVRVEDCGVEMFERFHDRLLSQNLSRLNEAVVSDTEEDGKALVTDRGMDFAFRSVRKGFGYYNFPCERYYGEVAWGGSKMDMGSCAQGIIGFSQSFDVFTADGDFIYHRWRGVYRMSRP